MILKIVSTIIIRQLIYNRDLGRKSIKDQNKNLIFN